MRRELLVVLLASAAWAQAPAPLSSPEVLANRSVTFRVRAPNARQVLLNLSGSERKPMDRDGKGVWTITTPSLPPDVYPYSFVVDGQTWAFELYYWDYGIGVFVTGLLFALTLGSMGSSGMGALSNLAQAGGGPIARAFAFADPSNPNVKTSIRNGPQSLLEVRGPDPQSWDMKEVPQAPAWRCVQGRIRQHEPALQRTQALHPFHTAESRPPLPVVRIEHCVR